MTEFLELVKGAPNFNAMERDELVMYAYAKFAAGAKTDSENAKLRELTQQMFALIENHEETKYMDGELGRQIVNALYERVKELGIEVD